MGSESMSHVDDSIAPSRDDLEDAYRTRDPDSGGHQQAEAVLAGDEGITVLCSANAKGEGAHTWLIRLAADGSERWEKHFAQEHGTGRAIVALPSGGFVIAGEVLHSPLEYQAHVMSVDADGSMIAEGTFGPRGTGGFDALARLNDGSILAGGSTDSKGWLVCIDDGLRLSWQLQNLGVSNIYGIAQLTDGGFALIVSEERSTTALGMARVAAFAADRRERWQVRLPTTGRGELTALAPLEDGIVAVGHRSASGRDTAQFWIVRLAATGDIVWEAQIGPPDEARRGRAVVPFADGSVAVAGHASSDGRHEVRVAGETSVWILRIDGNGRLLWERVFGSSS
jgi:hypothetical protein